MLTIKYREPEEGKQTHPGATRSGSVLDISDTGDPYSHQVLVTKSNRMTAKSIWKIGIITQQLGLRVTARTAVYV